MEVGDATLIICPIEDGEQDVILIDTGENDQDRIEAELVSNGFQLSDRPIDRMFISHYDHDHQGDAIELMPPLGLGGPFHSEWNLGLRRGRVTLVLGKLGGGAGQGQMGNVGTKE